MSLSPHPVFLLPPSLSSGVCYSWLRPLAPPLTVRAARQGVFLSHLHTPWPKYKEESKPPQPEITTVNVLVIIFSHISLPTCPPIDTHMQAFHVCCVFF